MAQSSQYTDPVEHSEYADLRGVINDQTQRRRLVFIRRLHQRNSQNTAFNATLRAAQNCPNQNSLTWLPWMSPYDSDDKLKILIEKCKKDVNPNVAFKKFSVILSSIMFLSDAQRSGLTNVLNYFVYDHHRQAGLHVFLDAFGKLRMISSMVYPYPELDYDGNLKYYDCFMTALTSVYPVIRHEWQTSGEDRLAYGLHFGQPSSGQTAGDISGRYYHRYSDYCLKAYGVNELGIDEIVKFKETIGDKPFTALYVCAGAKLIVLDPYTSDNISGRDENHNRVLIQQGGVVIYEGELNIKVHIKDRSKVGNLAEYRHYDWHEFCTKHIMPPKQDHHGPPITNLRQKVIFLCGLDSTRNTLAWGFSIHPINDSAQGTLMIPFESARNTPIEAIAEGIPGLDEIIARIGYEQLHDSVLTEHGTVFKPVQNFEMLRNILNVNGERYEDVNFRTSLSSLEKKAFFPSEVPKEFNLSNPNSKFLKLADNQFFNSQLNRTTRAAPPPMYPPILDGTNIQYWPSLEEPIANVETDSYIYDNNKRLSIEIKHGAQHQARKYTYSQTKVKAYHFERLTEESDQKYQNHSGHYHITNQNYYRIGVDGWMWRRVPSEVTDDGPKPIYDELNIFLIPRITAIKPQRPRGGGSQHQSHSQSGPPRQSGGTHSQSGQPRQSGTHSQQGTYGNRRGR